MVEEGIVHRLVEAEGPAEVLREVSQVISFVDAYPAHLCRGDVDIHIE